MTSFEYATKKLIDTCLKAVDIEHGPDNVTYEILKNQVTAVINFNIADNHRIIFFDMQRAIETDRWVTYMHDCIASNHYNLG